MGSKEDGIPIRELGTISEGEGKKELTLRESLDVLLNLSRALAALDSAKGKIKLLQDPRVSRELSEQYAKIEIDTESTRELIEGAMEKLVENIVMRFGE